MFLGSTTQSLEVSFRVKLARIWNMSVLAPLNALNVVTWVINALQTEGGAAALSNPSSGDSRE